MALLKSWSREDQVSFSLLKQPISLQKFVRINFLKFWNLIKSQQQPKCPLTEKWISKIWYIHAMDYYSAITTT